MYMLGIDEVGRGCWAGPVVAGAVVLMEPLDGVTDSKLLSPDRRRVLATQIHEQALACGLGWVPAEEVDMLGLTGAVRLAMQRATAVAEAALEPGALVEDIVIDGSYNFLADDGRARTVVKADLTIPAVSAASIIAKVARDQWMAQAAQQFPGYGFERHVGYGTAAHRQALVRQGICTLHRKSFRPIQAFC